MLDSILSRCDKEEASLIPEIEMTEDNPWNKMNKN